MGFWLRFPSRNSQTITRVHSLDEIGLRAGGEKLTAEGMAFVKLLRSGGTIPFAGNQMVMIKLAELLREWTGLPGDPIQLAKASRRWTAVFSCSSALREGARIDLNDIRDPRDADTGPAPCHTR